MHYRSRVGWRPGGGDPQPWMQVKVLRQLPRPPFQVEAASSALRAEQNMTCSPSAVDFTRLQA